MLSQTPPTTQPQSSPPQTPREPATSRAAAPSARQSNRLGDSSRNPVTSSAPSSLLNDELGKLVLDYCGRLDEATSFETFMNAMRHRSDLQPTVGTLPHPAAALLEDLRTQGVSVPLATPPWTMKQKTDAIERGAHRSAFGHQEFVRSEFVDMMKKGYFIVLPASENCICALGADTGQGTYLGVISGDSTTSAATHAIWRNSVTNLLQINNKFINF